jgi:hypothetical protein
MNSIGIMRDVGVDRKQATDKENRLSLSVTAWSAPTRLPPPINRTTILGGIEIGRAPGVARITFRAPTAALERVGLRALAEEIYGSA